MWFAGIWGLVGIIPCIWLASFKTREFSAKLSAATIPETIGRRFESKMLQTVVAIALIFGLFMIKPTPFCLLDEVDAPLDDANINRFIELVKEFSRHSQFLLITHNKKTMETPGVSKAVSVRLN